MTEQWLPVGGAAFEVRVGVQGAPIAHVPGAFHGVWYGIANPVPRPDERPLGLRRQEWHQARTAEHDAMFAKIAVDKSAAARGGLTITQMVALGPQGLVREADRRKARGQRLCASGFEETVDPDGYKRLTNADRSKYAEGKRELREASQLMDLAITMVDGWKCANAMDDLDAAEATRRRAAVMACGWGDCPGWRRAFQPGERMFSQCFKCNQVESAEGRVRCVFCSKPHAMKFATCAQCKNIEGRDEAAPFLRSMVTRRDGFQCQMCGDEEAQLQVDHILPCAFGGTAVVWNLQTLCTWCNILKGARFGPLDELARIDLMVAYWTHLGDFLSNGVDEHGVYHADKDEKSALRKDLETALM